MKEKIKVLILEDLSSDAELAEREVKAVLNNYKIVVVDTEQGFIKALENFKPDLIISDYQLPAFNGMKALQITRKKEEFIPFIILTGSMNEETAVKCMKAGADDYVIKEHIKRLGPAVLSVLDKKKIRQECLSAEKAGKQAEEALRESEMKFRNLSESTLTGIGLYQNDYWVYANPAAEEISGYTFDELKQMKYWEFVAPEFVDLIKERGISRQKGKLATSGYEFKIITKQGKEKWVFLTGNTTELKSGKAGLITVIDITERKQAEKALKESEEKYRKIFENVQDIFYQVDNEGNIIDISPSIKRYSGYSREELIGTPVTRVYNNTNERALLKAELEKKGEVVDYELRLKTKSQRLIYVSLNAHILYDENKKPAGIEGSLRDITERKQAEEEIRKLSRVIESTTQAVVISDLKTNIVYVNPALVNVGGYNNQNEIIGNSLFDFTDEEGQMKLQDEVIPALLQDGFYRSEIIIKKKNKSLFPAELNCALITDEIGAPIYLTALFEDITERKQAEKALKESEEKYRKIFENSPSGIMMIDENGIIREANAAISKIMGYSIDELIGRDVKKLTLPENKNLVNQNIKRILSGELLEQEIISCRKDGSHCNLILRETTIKLPNGKTGILSISDDITKRKQAEKALKENEEKYRELSTLMRLMADNMSDMLWAKNLNNEYIFVNKAMCTGLLNAKDINEPLGKTDMFFATRERNTHPDNPEWHTFSEIRIDSDAVTLEAMKPMYFDEFGNVRGKFLFLGVYKAPLYDSNGQLIGTVGSARDVTAAKEAENQLRKLSTAVTQSPAAIAITDTEGKLEYVNPKFTEITGYSLEEVIGQNPRILKSGKHSDEMYKELWETILSGKTWRGEMHNKKKNGELFWTSSSISPIFDEKGKIINFVDVAEDITEKKKTEQDLIRAKEKAEESDRLKTAFLANMSHEIRTPMNGILGFTGLLKEPQLTGDEKDAYIRIIEKSGNRMLNTVNDIVDISKIEARLVDVVKSEVSVNDILEEQYKFFYQEAKSKGIELNYKLSLSDNELRIITDQHKLEGIMTNLIKNAIKFTDTGSITFGYAIKTLRENDVVEFYVKDTGIGIPANRVEAIFNRFEQADIADTRAFQGSGLGLAIAKSYVEMLGGKISVKSKEGDLSAGQAGGSTFTFSIPYTKQLEKESDAKENINKEPQTSLSHLSVIIAEDDETSKLFYKAIFKNKFKKITYTTTGKETIEKFRENLDTDIILMDIKMPDINGYDATREIRKFNTDVVIIAQTAHGLSGDREKAIEAGCNDYISKPINKENLFEKIRACLDKKSD